MRGSITVHQGPPPGLHSGLASQDTSPPHPHCLPHPSLVLGSGVGCGPGAKLSGPVLYVTASFEANLHHSLLWGLAVVGPQAMPVE